MGKSKDTREVLSGIRLPGKGAGDSWPRKSSGQRDYTKGDLITDPDELQKLADSKQVNLQDLYDRGIITGEGWKGVKTSQSEPEGEAKKLKKAK